MRDAATRYPAIDVFRGTAIVAMVGYHLTWDMWAFGLTGADLLGDPLWLSVRTAIVSAFLFIAGFCADIHPGRGLRNILRRFGVLSCAAGAVSLGTWLAMPDQWVFFGILHHLALASLLTRAVRRAPAAIHFLGGVVVVVLGQTVTLSALDGPWLAWVGMATSPPNSLDHVPLFPWFGVVLIGLAAGRVVRAAPRAALLLLTHPRSPNAPLRALAWAGRWSLAIYLLHQGPLYGGVWATASILEPREAESPGEERSFVASCVTACAATTRTSRPEPPSEVEVLAACTRTCSCAVRGLRRDGLWRPLLEGTATPTERGAVEALVSDCRNEAWPSPERR